LSEERVELSLMERVKREHVGRKGSTRSIEVLGALPKERTIAITGARK